MKFLKNIDKNAKVLIAPLNWGLGHASRSIPIIREILDHGHNVVLASDGLALDLLKKEFVSVPFYELPSYNVDYKHKSMFLNMLRGAPGIQKAINEEFRTTQEIINKENIDVIISDNRYGVRSALVPSYVICHQIGIRTGNGMLDSLARKWHIKMLNRFDTCLIPDYEDRSLAGEMTKKETLKHAEYIGPLTRFGGSDDSEEKYDIIAILSGPEPQRTHLENDIIKVLEKEKYKSCLVRGTDLPLEAKVSHAELEVYDLLATDDLNHKINESSLIITRSGYSSIMDLTVLRKKAILIPTPGQTEQEYLGELHANDKGISVVQQSKIIDQLSDRIKEMKKLE